jgi:hypothetical protein
MDEDNSFDALMNPGEASNFFDIADLPEIDPTATAVYSRTNSLWLIEFSRLIYRQEKDEKPRPPNFITRNQFLGPKGWQEIAFFNEDDTQAGLLINGKLQCAALVFRGTLGLDDTITDAKAILVPWDGSGLIHDGFKDAFDAVWETLVKPKLLNLGMPFFITGHSLGAALGTLATARCLRDAALKTCQPLALYTFGSPRVGDNAFGADLKGIFHCRMVNDEDIVTTVPPPLPIPGVPAYQHAGQLHRIEHDGHLHIFPPDTDTLEVKSPRTGAINFVESLDGLLSGIRAFRLEPPEPLRDHTPVNYTARLERAS